MTSSSANTKCQKRYLNKTLKNITKNDPSTTKVVLNGYDLQDEKIASLAMSLVTNTHVQILYLSQCGITAKGAYLLAFALRKNSSLEHLWLNGNKIGSVGAEAIAAALFENETLMTLGLANNSIGNRGGKKIVEAIRENESITDIFLEGNRMNQRIVDEVQRLVDGDDDDREDGEGSYIPGSSSSSTSRDYPRKRSDKFMDLDDSTVTASVSPSCVGRMLDAIQEEEEEEDLSNDTGLTQDETDDDDDEEESDFEYLKCMSELDQLRRKKTETKMAKLRSSLTKFTMRVRRASHMARAG